MLYCYHVTPKANIQSILEGGIDPEMSRGKRKVVWLVEADRVHWAIAHASSRHYTDTNNLAIFLVRMERLEVIRTCWEGVYQTRKLISVTVNDIMDLEVFLNDPNIGSR